MGDTVEMPATRTGLRWPWSRAHSIDDTTSAAPPSEVAQMSSRRSGSDTTGELRTSSRPYSLVKRALGLWAPWREFLTFTMAKSSVVAP